MRWNVPVIRTDALKSVRNYDIERAMLKHTPLARLGEVTDIANAALFLCETTVHLPRRGRIWMATFTGPEGGQVWKSTGIAVREQALVLAKRWEAEARAHRLSRGGTRRDPVVRVHRLANSTGSLALTQKEVALLLGMSERGVREIERRALQKIRQHPLMRQVWQKYQANDLDENALVLTPEEVEALLNAAPCRKNRS